MIIDFNNAGPQLEQTPESRLMLVLLDFVMHEDRSQKDGLAYLLDVLRAPEYSSEVTKILADMLDPRERGRWKLELKRKGRGKPNKHLRSLDAGHLVHEYKSLVQDLIQDHKNKPAAAARAILCKRYGISVRAFDGIIDRNKNS